MLFKSWHKNTAASNLSIYSERKKENQSSDEKCNIVMISTVLLIMLN